MDEKIFLYIRKESIANFFFNAVVNGIIAWFIGRSAETLVLWDGGTSFGKDIVATTFFLLTIVALVVVPLKKKSVRNGKVPAIEWDQRLLFHRMLSKFPRNPILGALTFGFISLVFIVPLTLLPFFALGITEMTPFSFIVFKSIWGGILVAAMIWPIIMYALGNAKVGVQERDRGIQMEITQ